jgi:hypothetical protein
VHARLSVNRPRVAPVRGMSCQGSPTRNAANALQASCTDLGLTPKSPRHGDQALPAALIHACKQLERLFEQSPPEESRQGDRWRPGLISQRQRSSRLIRDGQQGAKLNRSTQVQHDGRCPREYGI